MSAPASAYLLIDFKFRGSNDVLQIVNPAKAQADLATLKARFYLDDIIGFKAVYAGVEYHGFWGVVLPSGYNYDHHKPSRLLEINCPQTGKILRTFNDAGLNTLCRLDTQTIRSFKIDDIKIRSYILSAYYLSTTIDIYYESGGNWIKWVDTQNLAQAVDALIDFENTSVGSKIAGEYIAFKIVASNLDGDQIKEFSIVLSPVAFTSIKYHPTVASYANNQTNSATLRDVYPEKTPIFSINNRHFKSDVVPFVTAENTPKGYYINSGNWYFLQPASEAGLGGTYGDFAVVTASGVAASGTYPAGDPGNSSVYTTIEFVSFDSTSSALSCGMSTSAFTYYLKTSTGKLCTDPPITGPGLTAPDGYYTTIEASVRKWYRYVDGFVVSNGNC